MRVAGDFPLVCHPASTNTSFVVVGGSELFLTKDTTRNTCTTEDFPFLPFLAVAANGCKHYCVDCLGF